MKNLTYEQKLKINQEILKYFKENHKKKMCIKMQTFGVLLKLIQLKREQILSQKSLVSCKQVVMLSHCFSILSQK